jgi:hypothetical protein
VNTLLRSLIVWLLMLALPWQGVAAAAMVGCAPLPSPALSMHAAHDAARPPCHEGMATQDGATQEPAQPEQKTGTHHAGAAKCTTCAACGIAAVLPAAFPPFAPAPPPGLSAPLTERVLPTVHLDQPERPPRFFLA